MIHRAKKSMGQNFLKSKGALRKIIESAELSAFDIVLEIGPGKGALTELLLQKAKQIIAVEKDRALFEYLKEKFASEISEGKLVLVEDDILLFENYSLLGAHYKIVANIPYNITGAILKKFLTADIQPKEMMLLVQKEVAQRIVASDKKESILSISVKAYGTPKYIAKVPARDFSPAPKVDSAIIAVKNISRENFTEGGEKFFFEVVRAGFAHKRKVLVKNLEDICPREHLVKIFKELDIPEKIRAEDVSVEKWLTLTAHISKTSLSPHIAS